MKKVFFVLSVLFFVAETGCNKGDHQSLTTKSAIQAVTDDPSISTLAGTWKVVSYENYSDSSALIRSELSSAVNGKDIVLTFGGNLSGGSLTGHTLVNEVDGTYQVGDEKGGNTGTNPNSAASRNVKVFFGATKAGVGPAGSPDQQWEGNIWNLDEASNYVVNSKYLRIFYANNSKSITFVKL